MLIAVPVDMVKGEEFEPIFAAASARGGAAGVMA
jgi:hypothetical protein